MFRYCIIFFFFIFLLPSVIKAQINRYGVPFVNTYKTGLFTENPQYWDLACDRRGVMYFANLSGIVEYDGETFRPIIISSGDGGVESLGCD